MLMSVVDTRAVLQHIIAPSFRVCIWKLLTCQRFMLQHLEFHLAVWQLWRAQRVTEADMLSVCDINDNSIFLSILFLHIYIYVLARISTPVKVRNSVVLFSTVRHTFKKAKLKHIKVSGVQWRCVSNQLMWRKQQSLVCYAWCTKAMVVSSTVT